MAIVSNFVFYKSNDSNLRIIKNIIHNTYDLYYKDKSILTSRNLAHCKRMAKPLALVDRLKWTLEWQ